VPGATVTAAVEGDTDAAIVRRVLDEVGLELSFAYGLKGKNFLDRNLAGYNRAAQHTPWLIVRDLDIDASCAPILAPRLLPLAARQMCLCVAVHSVEAWLLADREKLSEFLRVAKALVPAFPETETWPKRTLVNLARRSRRRAIREDMVPPEGFSSAVGPGYRARLIEFAQDHWRPAIAARSSNSLARCLRKLAAWT
jgi:hypothetical protein